jgi:hypothetical protein
MLETHDGAPAGTGTPSRRRPLRRRLPTVEVSDQQEAPKPPPEPDRTAALAAHTDERYQDLQIRLERIENAFRRLVRANRDAVRGTDLTVQALLSRIESLVTSVEGVAARQEEAFRSVDVRHRAELTEFAKRAGKAVAAVGATLRTEFASSAEEIRNGLRQLHFDLTTTAERIAGHEHPPAAVTMSPELEIALRESSQRQEAVLDRHLRAILEAIPRPREASAGPSAVPEHNGFDEIEDGLVRVADELGDLTE